MAKTKQRKKFYIGKLKEVPLNVFFERSFLVGLGLEEKKLPPKQALSRFRMAHYFTDRRSVQEYRQIYNATSVTYEERSKKLEAKAAETLQTVGDLIKARELFPTMQNGDDFGEKSIQNLYAIMAQLGLKMRSSKEKLGSQTSPKYARDQAVQTALQKVLK